MYAFHSLLKFAGVSKIKDTQCGFKLFSRASARSVFNNTHVEGWIFDVEVLQILDRLRIPVAEVAVNWKEVDGSKISLISDSLKMAFDLLLIKVNYFFGVWKIKAI
jgi:dolichyl-phosphate beta-glucosyltransferase